MLSSHITKAPLDIKITVLDPTDPCPAKVAAGQTVGNFRDMAAVRCAPDVPQADRPQGRLLKINHHCA